ncbi:hypothetical protein GBA52_018999 [Prunus armeniaca]|nr:hypothetical protein GBA52_018999 [Prunus armeniaca]
MLRSTLAVSHILSKLLQLQQLSSMKQVEAVQGFLTKTGLFFTHTSIVAKLVAFASLSPLGCLVHAQALFEETTMDDPFICNSMIRAYANSVFPIKAIHIYNHMQETNVRSDNFTYNFALRACARVMKRMEEDEVKACGFVIDRKGSEIHCRVLKLGFDCDLYVQNSLIFVYSHCGSVELARCVFDEMTDRSASSWNIMLTAYDQVADFESADYLFQSMPEKNVVSWNTLLARHVRLSNIEAAQIVFREMPVRNSVSWNSMIAGYVRVRDYDGALKLFREMQIAEVEATEVTLISILGACAETGALEIGRKIHESLNLQHHKIGGYLGGVLVDMYCKCGKLSSAWEMVQEYKIVPDEKHYGCMVDLLSRWGLLEEAFEMIKAVPSGPSSLLWRTLLGACRVHVNVELAEQSFQQLAKLEPLMDADYVLLSNMYAEAERWDDVERLRNEMICKEVSKTLGFSHVEMK